MVFLSRATNSGRALICARVEADDVGALPVGVEHQGDHDAVILRAIRAVAMKNGSPT